MKEPKMHIRHLILGNFKNNEHATKAVKNICNIYGQGAITDQVFKISFRWYFIDSWIQPRMLIRPRSI